ncbi:MAG: DUF2752 domain-containing protein [Leptolyngbyaceae cyanobacterium SL_7_1]|nr:DUF2752 domain-containing protein [Leptolyngbyaceae cyanobacterium SL_7_1]
MAIAPLLGSILYNYGFRIPGVHCLFQAWLRIPGPGCGLTRSFMAIARQDWQTAVHYHLLGPVLFVCLLLAALHTTIELISRRAWSTPYTRFLCRPWVVGAAGFLVFGYYALRLYARYSDNFPSVLKQSLLWQWLISSAHSI